MQLKVLVLLWKWWSARNKANTGDRMPRPSEICSTVNYYLMEFEKLANQNKPKEAVSIPKWRAPPVDYYKVNVDASFHAATLQGGWGFVVRNSNGEFLEGGAGNMSRVSGALQAETLAVQMSLQRVAQFGMSRIILETDATILGTALTSMDMDQSPNGCLFKQIREFMFSNFVHCTVSICSRLCNRAADSLAALGAT